MKKKTASLDSVIFPTFVHAADMTFSGKIILFQYNVSPYVVIAKYIWETHELNIFQWELLKKWNHKPD